MSTQQDDVVVEDKDQPSYLEMSDEELMKLPPPELPQVVKDEKKSDVIVDTKVDEKDDDLDEADDAKKGEQDEKADDLDEGDEAGDSKAEKPKAGEEGKDKKEPEAKVDDKAAPDVDASKSEAKADKSDEKDVKKDEPAINYEAEYKKLLAPFRANGRDIQVNSVDDAISLMQMGANYNKQMAAFKPARKLLKMLEHNGLMSEEKISFLIDLSKKDPGAINKLVKDSGLDPMDLDAEKASAYKQSTYAVDDREIELDTVLNEIQGTPAYTQLLDVVSNKWDVASKQVVSQEPQLLKVLHGHMASGVYDLISTEIERERLFGRLNGLSDLQAYRQVGDAIQARGGFDHLFKKQVDTKPPAGAVVAPKPKQEEPADLKDKRRAASSTKPAPPSSDALKGLDPLNMSDDEFAKLSVPKFK